MSIPEHCLTCAWFLLTGEKIGENIVFFVKYCGENRYSVKLELSSWEQWQNSISYQPDTVPLSTVSSWNYHHGSNGRIVYPINLMLFLSRSTDPGSARREGNALDVHQSIFQKITTKAADGLEILIRIKVTKMQKLGLVLFEKMRFIYFILRNHLRHSVVKLVLQYC